MRLFIGLGNPSREYAKQRHNVGFMVIDHFAQQHGLSFKDKKSKAKIAEGDVRGHAIILAKPQTYMNLSGVSVQGLVHRYKLSLEDILVICDDMDLPLGKIRLRLRGSSGGHKGLQSIIDALNRQDFPRLRVGIGRPDACFTENEVIKYVLSAFKQEEVSIINEAISRAAEVLFFLAEEGLEAAMNKYNPG